MFDQLKMSKIAVYFMPGMAVSSRIFDRIQLDNVHFDVHRLEWFLPKKGMTFREYAHVMCSKVAHNNPVLIGVSLGGMLVQEMSNFIKTKRIIIISSIKRKDELPKRMLFARYTKIHKLLPTGIVNNVEFLTKYAFGETVKKRLKLYEKYLAIRDKQYIDWAIDNCVNWKQTQVIKGLIHIHGDQDTVFPISNIKDCVAVKNGTHTMIIHRALWFNQNLPRLILKGK